MSSYFDYFSNNIENFESENAEIIQGICYAMCPQDELHLREKEKLVHVLEVVDTERKLVKSYSRSAADTNMAVPRHLRPFSILIETEEYLLFQVTKRTDVSLSVVYDFVNDRLRAVRQDMTIQRFPPNECAQLLEPMVRFYIYFGYRLHGLPIRDFDPVLNKKYLLECIKWFLKCCDSLDDPYSKRKSSEISDDFNKLNINGRQKKSYDRVLMESLYILCNLDEIHPLVRYINLSKDLKMKARLQLAYKVALANYKGNFVRVSKLLGLLCPLSYCALCLHLPTLQKRALEVLSMAYNSSRLTVSSDALRRWLAFSSEWEARAVARHYGLVVDGDTIRLQKAAFKLDTTMHTPKIQFLHHGQLNLDLDYIFTYKL